MKKLSSLYFGILIVFIFLPFKAYLAVNYNNALLRPTQHSKGNALTITTKDKFSGIILNETDVYLKNKKGIIIYKGKTNQQGIVTFTNIKPNDYNVTASFFGIALDTITIKKQEFKVKNIIEKMLEYSNADFIVIGKILECNSTKVIDHFDVVLERTDDPNKKNATTNYRGNFYFQLPNVGEYILYGKNAKFAAKPEEVIPTYFDRKKILFVKIEKCAALEN